jgi:hypothetical protein
MSTSITETIQEAARTGLGVVNARDLPAADAEFGWQRLRAAPANETYGGQNIAEGAQIEVALGREGTPQGRDIVLVRDTASPALVHVYEKSRWQQLCAGIIDGQWNMLT